MNHYRLNQQHSHCCRTDTSTTFVIVVYITIALCRSTLKKTIRSLVIKYHKEERVSSFFFFGDYNGVQRKKNKFFYRYIKEQFFFSIFFLEKKTQEALLNFIIIVTAINLILTTHFTSLNYRCTVIFKAILETIERKV